MIAVIGIREWKSAECIKISDSAPNGGMRLPSETKKRADLPRIFNKNYQ